MAILLSKIYIQKDREFNLAECCGFRIEGTDKVFSDRKCILMEYVENNS